MYGTDLYVRASIIERNGRCKTYKFCINSKTQLLRALP